MRGERRRGTGLAYRTLTCEAASVGIIVGRPKRSAILWSAANEDSEAELLRLAVCAEDGGTECAWADRYGGAGIGGNGGSGRAAHFGGMLIKGVGRTPLIGRTTNHHHISGGAYLEEAVRETIFAEIYAQELPWGAVRTKAIIDIFEDQIWTPDPESDFPINCEHRILLVREPVLRPAHLQRAALFTGEEALTGVPDIERVEHNRSKLVCAWGASGLETRLRRFWLRWCDQYAYMFVWRLTQGSPSTSNIALDGRLLDFGAASSLPDWCAAVVFPGEPENGYEFPQIAQYMQSFYAEHRDGSLTRGEFWGDYVAALAAQCRARYFRTLGVEMLRLAGLRRSVIMAAISSSKKRLRLESAAASAAKRYLRVFRPEIETDNHAGFWDFSSFWEDEPPHHLVNLRSVADELVRSVPREPIRERMRVRCKPRDGIFRETFRRRLHGELPRREGVELISASKVASIIAREVTRARRDTRYEPAFDYLFGFALAGHASYALFRRSEGSAYAVKEPSPGASAKAQSLEQSLIRFNENGDIDGENIEALHLL